MPQYMALIYGDEQTWERMSEDEQKAVYDRYYAFVDAAGSKVVGGSELQPTATATTVRVRNDETLVTDGPYAELKEALGGYFLLQCDTIGEACELAAQIPAAEHGAIEVRPAYVEEAQS